MGVYLFPFTSATKLHFFLGVFLHFITGDDTIDRVARYEGQLMEQLKETERELLTKLIRSQQEIDSITARENFILGFRLGVRLMSECMDDNDGDIRNGGE